MDFVNQSTPLNKWRGNISALSDNWNDLRRKVRNAYFEYVNPKLGQIKEEIDDFSFLRRLSVPENFSMWFGIAAGVTGLLLLMESELYWYWQLLLILSIILIGPLVSRLLSFLFHGADNVLAVYPGKQYIGQKITLEKEIKDGVGEAILEGETWHIQGDDLAAGTRVKIVAVKKNILYVVTAMKVFDEESETPPSA